MFESPETTERQITACREDARLASLEFNLGDSSMGLGVVNIMAASVGVWGLICLISGLGNCSALQELTRGLIVALTGI